MTDPGNTTERPVRRFSPVDAARSRSRGSPKNWNRSPPQPALACRWFAVHRRWPPLCLLHATWDTGRTWQSISCSHKVTPKGYKQSVYMGPFVWPLFPSQRTSRELPGVTSSQICDVTRGSSPDSDMDLAIIITKAQDGAWWPDGIFPTMSQMAPPPPPLLLDEPLAKSLNGSGHDHRTRKKTNHNDRILPNPPDVFTDAPPYDERCRSFRHKEPRNATSPGKSFNESD